MSRPVLMSSRRRPRCLCAAIAMCCAVSVLAAAANALAVHPGYAPGTHLRGDRPHPAVARIVVPEGEATSYGSGTLVDVRDQFGLVITNWHVVRDGRGDVEVVFPDGFRSKARPLKVDADWDLAALVIWRPPTPPVPIATRAPQSGDQLTICGYGQGQYRAATGRCTQYYAPKLDLPQHMVELDVEARQGDSGGPIFNERGELAGVLFGATGGTTLGSFNGRVESFLSSLAPDIGRAADSALLAGQASSPGPTATLTAAGAGDDIGTEPNALSRNVASGNVAGTEPAALWAPAAAAVAVSSAQWAEGDDHAASGAVTAAASSGLAASAAPVAAASVWMDNAKTVLAIIGAIAIVLHASRLAR